MQEVVRDEVMAAVIAPHHIELPATALELVVDPRLGRVGVLSLVLRLYLEWVRRDWYCESTSGSLKSTSSCTKWSQGTEIGALLDCAPSGTGNSPRAFSLRCCRPHPPACCSGTETLDDGVNPVFMNVDANPAVGRCRPPCNPA